MPYLTPSELLAPKLQVEGEAGTWKKGETVLKTNAAPPDLTHHQVDRMIIKNSREFGGGAGKKRPDTFYEESDRVGSVGPGGGRSFTLIK